MHRLGDLEGDLTERRKIAMDEDWLWFFWEKV